MTKNLNLMTPDTAVVDVKSKFTSKVNITAFLLAVFAGASAAGWLPAGLATPDAVAAVVAAASGLIAVFRSTSNAVLK